MFNQSRVLLPNSILEQEQQLDKHKFLSLVNEYLKLYPGYELLYIENRFAVCERTEMEGRI